MKKKMAAAQEILDLKDNKNIAIVYRYGKPEAVALAKKMTQWLKKHNYQVYTAPEQKVLAGTLPIQRKSQFDKVGLILVFGGDGTYLRAVRLMQNRQIPILAFNMGSLGFLATHHANEAFTLTQEALDGKMKLSPRSMICAEVYRNKKLYKKYFALNDVVLERGAFSQLIHSSIFSEKFLVSEVKADGFIVSTPSGSTAYNLAAGGPVMHPDVAAFVVTPVAPHSLTSRPLIFPDNKPLSFKIIGPTIKAHLVIDGQKMVEISDRDELVITKSPYDHWVVRTPSYNFFHLLRDKLKFGDR